MAQIDAVSTNIALSMLDPELVNATSILNNTGDTTYFNWIAGPALQFNWTALSFDEDITYAPEVFLAPNGGTIHGLVLQKSSVDVLSITDLVVPITGLIDTYSPTSNLQSFWETVMAGDSQVFAPDVTPAVSDAPSLFFGDFNTVESGTATGGNDTFVSGTLFGLNQGFLGDAFIVGSDAKLNGGNDVFTIMAKGAVIGDALSNAGELVGGHDRIDASGAFVTGTFSGDTSTGGGKLTGGDDIMTFAQTGTLTLVTGDTGDTGFVASKGGKDRITITGAALTPTSIGDVVGDFMTGYGAFTGGADVMTLTKIIGSGIGGDNDLSGDGLTSPAAVVGGADTMDLLGGSNFDNIVGDIVDHSGSGFAGGGDTMTLVDFFATFISGDAKTYTAGVGSFTGGGDTVSLDLEGRGSAMTVVGDFSSSNAATTAGGNDTITFTETSAFGALSIFGDGATAAIEGQTVNGGNDTITVSTSLATLLVGDVDYLDGTLFRGGNDSIKGGSGKDVIYGDWRDSDDTPAILKGGDDVLDGRRGNDEIYGNEGNDQLTGGLGNDILNGGDGTDAARFDSVAQSVYVDLNGIAGTDSKEAMGQGFDDLSLIENVVASLRNDVVLGSGQANILFGLDGNDRLSGRGGIDTLVGGLGRDILRGGAFEKDVFDFNDIAETGKSASTRDIIVDFEAGVDDIDLSTIDANGSAAGHKFTFLAAKGAAFTGAKGDLRWFQENPAGAANDKTIVEGDVNGDKKADFQIELRDLHSLAATDFLL